MVGQPSQTASQARSAKQSKSPLVRLGYDVRTKLIEKSLSLIEDAIIVILGAGLEEYLSQINESCVCIEIDLPSVCNEKRKIMESKMHVLDHKTAVLYGKTSTLQEYYLFSANLNQIEKLDAILEPFRQRNLFFVSEVCLCYLAKKVWKYCASKGNLIAYEPIGASGCTSTTLESYQSAYYEMFRRKVNMNPVGESIQGVLDDLQQAGFVHSAVANAGQAAVAHELSLEPDPSFDEHVALTLHLQSYALICGFQPNTKVFLRQLLCPWMSQLPPRSWDDFYVVEMSQEYTDAVKAGFLETYQGFFQEYSTLSKMHKSVLRKDFRDDIRQWYRQAHGIYLVAVDKNDLVIGGIGLRQVGENNHSGRTYELQRLWVNDDWRRKGVASALMKVLYEFAPKDSTMILTTLTILPAARRFYSKEGFELVKEETKHELTYVTYRREL